MIASYKGRFAEAIAKGLSPKRFAADLRRPTQRKLAAMIAAADINDLRVPPGNRLEALSGDRAGQHPIRINDQWRICFRWVDGRAEDVEIVDYH